MKFVIEKNCVLMYFYALRQTCLFNMVYQISKLAGLLLILHVVKIISRWESVCIPGNEYDKIIYHEAPKKKSYLNVITSVVLIEFYCF